MPDESTTSSQSMDHVRENVPSKVRKPLPRVVASKAIAHMMQMLSVSQVGVLVMSQGRGN